MITRKRYVKYTDGGLKVWACVDVRLFGILIYRRMTEV